MATNRMCQDVQSVFGKMADPSMGDKFDWARRHLSSCPDCEEALEQYEKEHPDYLDKIPCPLTDEEIAKRAEELWPVLEARSKMLKGGSEVL